MISSSFVQLPFNMLTFFFNLVKMTLLAASACRWSRLMHKHELSDDFQFLEQPFNLFPHELRYVVIDECLRCPVPREYAISQELN